MTERDPLDPDAIGNEAAEADDNLVLDLEDVSDELPKFEAIPAGTYNCVIENTEYGPSKKGNPMITWTLKVLDPPYDSRYLFYHTVLNSDAGLTRLKRMLTRVLPDIDLGKFNPSVFARDGEGLGHMCRAKVRIKQGQNNITDVLAPSEEAGAFLDEDMG